MRMQLPNRLLPIFILHEALPILVDGLWGRRTTCSKSLQTETNHVCRYIQRSCAAALRRLYIQRLKTLAILLK